MIAIILWKHFHPLPLSIWRRNCHSQNHCQLPWHRPPHSSGATGGFCNDKSKFNFFSCFFFVCACVLEKYISVPQNLLNFVTFYCIYFAETWCQLHHEQQRNRKQEWCSFPGRQTAHHSVCAGWNWPGHRKSPPHCVLFCRSHYQLNREGKSLRNYKVLIKPNLLSPENSWLTFFLFSFFVTFLLLTISASLEILVSYHMCFLWSVSKLQMEVYHIFVTTVIREW